MLLERELAALVGVALVNWIRFAYSCAVYYIYALMVLNFMVA